MQEEYLSVKEFAELAKVSQQTIYKQLNTRLKPYITYVKGQKKISKVALSEYYDFQNENSTFSTENNQIQPKKQPDSTDFQPKSTQVEQPFSTQKEDNTTAAAKEDRIAELEKQLEYLIRSDREEKEFLIDQIRQKDKQIELLNNRLEETNNNLTMAQQLAAADKKKLLELEIKQQEKEVIDPEEKTAAAEPEKKKSFFARLFS